MRRAACIVLAAVPVLTFAAGPPPAAAGAPASKIDPVGARLAALARPDPLGGGRLHLLGMDGQPIEGRAAAESDDGLALSW